MKFIRKFLLALFTIIPGSPIRVFILKLLGANIGPNVYIAPGVIISTLGTKEELRLLTLKENAGISHGVILVLRIDYRPMYLSKLYPEKVLPITLEKGAGIGAGSIIFPGVTIGEGSYAGAGSVVLKDVPSYSLVAGNPAKKIKDLDKVDHAS